ncbi:hypothetical protein B0J13DRAFT_522856 [Dactylonectria estremocensis]|uniref:Uncharacterized protein n=1 Tax=Dactylonectria estremocensis TaxID=1079267 RepID=A0A9P9F105_9HYPO|nr:hypothetical protein B0J13DRAFT_522856 [Dactylonectria estremocensis]
MASDGCMTSDSSCDLPPPTNKAASRHDRRRLAKHSTDRGGQQQPNCIDCIRRVLEPPELGGWWTAGGTAGGAHTPGEQAWAADSQAANEDGQLGAPAFCTLGSGICGGRLRLAGAHPPNPDSAPSLLFLGTVTLMTLHSLPFGICTPGVASDVLLDDGLNQDKWNRDHPMPAGLGLGWLLRSRCGQTWTDMQLCRAEPGLRAPPPWLRRLAALLNGFVSPPGWMPQGEGRGQDECGRGVLYLWLGAA